ncbi:unnamed protein product, partial [Leptidea sinapis]
MLSSALHKELSEIKQELLEYRKSIDFLSNSHDDLIKAVERLSSENTQLKKENGSLSSTVLNLSERLNNLEQQLRENNLVLNLVPESRSESLPNLVQQCANFIGHKLNNVDIVHCTRVAKRDKDSKIPRAIVLKIISIKLSASPTPLNIIQVNASTSSAKDEEIRHRTSINYHPVGSNHSAVRSRQSSPNCEVCQKPDIDNVIVNSQHQHVNFVIV